MKQLKSLVKDINDAKITESYIATPYFAIDKIILEEDAKKILESKGDRIQKYFTDGIERLVFVFKAFDTGINEKCFNSIGGLKVYVNRDYYEFIHRALGGIQYELMIDDTKTLYFVSKNSIVAFLKGLNK